MKVYLAVKVSFKHFLNDRDGQVFFRLPTGMHDEQILDAVDLWDGSLEKYGWQVSTGRVVPFRAEHLLKEKITTGNGTVPLLWMQNVKPYCVEYPLSEFDKPQAISTQDSVLLVPNSNYVLLRRFSSKEDRRRLISAPLIGKDYDFEQIGFENHLNFIYGKKGDLLPSEAIGLSALSTVQLLTAISALLTGIHKSMRRSCVYYPCRLWKLSEVLAKKSNKFKISPPNRLTILFFRHFGK